MRALLGFLALGLSVAGAGCAGPWRPEPLVTDFGLGHLIHPLQKPDHVGYPVGCPDPCAKEHVYIFAVNGLNPLCLGNFNGMCGYLREQGFEHTYFAQPYTAFWFPDEIREVRARDPAAKVVLIGFSWGANSVRALAHRLAADGIRVDLLIYLVGDTIWNTPYSRPPNVCRIVNVRGRGLVLLGGLCDGADLDGARNEQIDCRHILAPSRRETLDLVMEELLALACTPAAPCLPGPPGR
jgi:pimeloyl-ACP methyl ester carboxylesterase